MAVAEKTFEDKRIEAEFQLIWNRLANMEWHELQEVARYAFMQGRESARIDQMRQAERQKETL